MRPTDPVAGSDSEHRRHARIEHALRLWRQAEGLLDCPGHVELRRYYDAAIAMVAERLDREATMDELLEHYLAARRPADFWAEAACRTVGAPRRLTVSLVEDAAFMRRLRALIAAAV